jgi:hypothetical protein
MSVFRLLSAGFPRGSSAHFGAFHWKLAVDEGLIAMSIEDGSTDAAPPLSTTVMMAAAKQRPRWPPGR